MGRTEELFRKWGNFGFTGRVLAAVLVASARHDIWPGYILLRKHWIALGWPGGYTWVASAVYFSFWVWLWVLLFREGKRHPLMILDAVCAGSLFTVAVALHAPPVRIALSELGFGAATWVTFICASLLVIASSVSDRKGIYSDIDAANESPVPDQPLGRWERWRQTHRFPGFLRGLRFRAFPCRKDSANIRRRGW